jgi:hypothetical protein
LVLGGFSDIVVRSFGENKVLIHIDNPSKVVEAGRKHDQWWRGLFKEVFPWAPQMVVRNRRVWMRVSGLPLHVWEERSFKLLGALFGEFLDFDHDTIDFNWLEFAWILVSTTHMDMISEHLKVVVMGVVFNIWAVEEVNLMMGVMKKGAQDWEEVSSASSHGGHGGGEEADFLEDCSDASPRKFSSVNLGDLVRTTLTCQNLLLSVYKGVAEKTVLEDQQIFPPLKHPFSSEQMADVQVAKESVSLPMQQKQFVKMGQVVSLSAVVGKSVEGCIRNLGELEVEKSQDVGEQVKSVLMGAWSW